MIVNNKITTIMNENKIRVIIIDNDGYILLTDLAKYRNLTNPWV